MQTYHIQRLIYVADKKKQEKTRNQTTADTASFQFPK